MSQSEAGDVGVVPVEDERTDRERWLWIEEWIRDSDGRQIAAGIEFKAAVVARDEQLDAIKRAVSGNSTVLGRVVKRLAGAEEAISSAAQSEHERIATLADGFVSIDGRMCGFEMAMKAGFAEVSAEIKALAGRLNVDEMETYEKNLALGIELGLHKKHVAEVEIMREKQESHQNITLSEIDRRMIDHALQLADTRTRQQRVDDFLAKHFPTKTGRLAVLVGGVGAAAPVIKVLWDVWSKMQ